MGAAFRKKGSTLKLTRAGGGKEIEALLERQTLQTSRKDGYASRAETVAASAEGQRNDMIMAIQGTQQGHRSRLQSSRSAPAVRKQNRNLRWRGAVDKNAPSREREREREGGGRW